MESTTPTTRSPLRRLGLVGLSELEAPILAALATESPLLLIGPHGTAKSLLLTRIAEALGLPFRHYNASLLNFDDLVGFPLPGRDGSLEYVRTPGAIWGAGAVFFDEISRCRPEIQNKLFPIVHERRVQGIALEELRHRWAAMNPPCSDEDGNGDENGYVGSEPLDAALADRFAFILTIPPWSGFRPEEQLAVIRAREVALEEADARAFRGAVECTRRILALPNEALAESTARYVQLVTALLAQAGFVLSPRRANLLWRGVLSVNAASLALDPGATPSDAALVALRASLPQRAEGVAIPEVKLLAAHREAERAASLDENDPLHAILSASDPLERLRLATRAGSLERAELSRVVGDVIAQLEPGAREAVIVHLFETGVVGRLNAALASQAGETYREIATPPSFSEVIHGGNSRYATWGRIKDLLSRLDPEEPRAHLHANAIAVLFARKQLVTPADAERAFEAFATADRALRSS
jgi:MoxR-like ATPase